MTTVVPHTVNLTSTLGDCNEAEKPQRSRLSITSITMGILSIAAFWMIGLGFGLGVAAVICGTIATSRPRVADDELASLQALLGIAAGAAGITVSAGAAMLPTLVQL